ncbi:connectin [Frankliniella occidentalis]|uniref:Connectin n=1 Tax=Frankliniella occidentalis TaxID=133901 RepID=A0A6J1SI79_FRAOC|nr:connectin [Frankliniella occidentalis]XP_052123113.1 connectin [Frankliniella occidentalis]
MARPGCALLLCATLLLIGDAGAAGAKRSKDKDPLAKDPKDASSSQRRKSLSGTSAAPTAAAAPGRGAVMNLCDSFHIRTLNVYCSCSSQQLLNATEASCWVFGKSENESAPIWDSFSSQPNLETLKINVRDESVHKFVPTRALSFLRKLKLFEIMYATISELQPYAFANLTTLQELQLKRNQIITLKPRSFAWLPNLTTVNLGENQVAEVHREVFLGLPSLRRLFLDRNNITTLHDGSFTHLSGLDELELNDNQLAVLTRETFSGLKMLRRLLLNNNKLRMLGDCTFCEMPHLTELYLNENGLQYLSVRAFEGLSRLSRLMLGDNALQVLSPGSLNGLARMRYLDLRNNELNTLPYETVKPLMDNFKNVSSYFYIEGNRFVCDCRLSWIYQLRNETPNEQIRTSLEETTCVLSLDGADPAPAHGVVKPGLIDHHQNGLLHGAQQQQVGAPVPHRGRLFASHVSTDGPGFIRDEAVVVHNKKHDKDDSSDYDADDVDEDYSGPEDLMASQQQRVSPSGTDRKLLELDPEQLPCPEPVKQPTPTADDLDVDLIGQEFDDINGVQTLTGTVAGSSGAPSLSAALVLACVLLVGRPRFGT